MNLLLLLQKNSYSSRQLPFLNQALKVCRCSQSSSSNPCVCIYSSSSCLRNIPGPPFSLMLINLHPTNLLIHLSFAFVAHIEDKIQYQRLAFNLYYVNYIYTNVKHLRLYSVTFEYRHKYTFHHLLSLLVNPKHIFQYSISVAAIPVATRWLFHLLAGYQRHMSQYLEDSLVDITFYILHNVLLGINVLSCLVPSVLASSLSVLLLLCFIK